MHYYTKKARSFAISLKLESTLETNRDDSWLGSISREVNTAVTTTARGKRVVVMSCTSLFPNIWMGASFRLGFILAQNFHKSEVYLACIWLARKTLPHDIASSNPTIQHRQDQASGRCRELKKETVKRTVGVACIEQFRIKQFQNQFKDQSQSNHCRVNSILYILKFHANLYIRTT